MNVPHETVSPETAAPSPDEIEAAVIEAALPLPAPGPRGSHVFWTRARLLQLRRLLVEGKRDAEIAAAMSTPDWRLSATSIRVRLSRLGWVQRRAKRRTAKAAQVPA